MPVLLLMVLIAGIDVPCTFGGTDSDLLADEIVVRKAEKSLFLFSKGNEIARYNISLGKNPNGHKHKRGDGRTPEGRYIIDRKNPASHFHLALHISYPNQKDQSNARISGVDPGGDIMIHGLPNQWSWIGKMHQVWNWTDGCIAVTNSEIEEIWQAVKIGTPIIIDP